MKQTIAICLGKGKNILFCCLSLFYCYLAHAEIDQNAFVWSGINILNDASTTLPFLFDAAAQARYNITEGTYAETRTEIGLGRQLNPNLSGWIGYNWIGRNNSSDDDASQQEQRLWQQFIWSPFTQHSNFTIRSRFEERKDVDRQVWGLRLRERFTWRFPKKIANKLTPIIYDEIFFTVKPTDWTTNRFIDQNRIFAGIEIPVIKKTNLQIGYLSRLTFESPDKLDHILYVNMNLIF